MNKKGLTLIELLAVLAVIGMISLLVFPLITQHLSKTRSQIDDATKMSIVESSKLYVEDHIGETLFINKNSEQIRLIDLVEAGYLQESIRNVITRTDYKLDTSKIVVTRTGNYPTYTYDYKLELAS